MNRMLISIAFAVAFILLGYLLGTLFGLDSLQNRAFMLAVLAFGLVLGMLLDWLIEEAYRRNRELLRQMDDLRLDKPPVQTTQVERIIERVQHQLPITATVPISAPTPADNQLQAQALLDFLHERDDELKSLREQLLKTEEKIQGVRGEFDAYVKTHPDDLTVIKGIGPVYQWKLRDIGINTFRQLAEADAEKLRRMLDIKNWQKTDIEGWIAQSRDWAQRG